MVEEDEVIELNFLIEKLENTPKQPVEIANLKYQKFCQGIMERMLSSGNSYGEISDSMDHLMRPDFKEYMKSIDNNLARQVDITNKCVDTWFEKGEKIAPYYPWRITVILRKEKLFDLERRFLAAYCRHFYGLVGGRYEMIAARAVKIGVNPNGEIDYA